MSQARASACDALRVARVHHHGDVEDPQQPRQRIVRPQVPGEHERVVDG